MPVLPALHRRFTVYGMDWRGRGSSGHEGAYATEREIEAVAVVLDSCGRPAELPGHWFVGLCALVGGAGPQLAPPGPVRAGQRPGRGERDRARMGGAHAGNLAGRLGLQSLPIGEVGGGGHPCDRADPGQARVNHDPNRHPGSARLAMAGDAWQGLPGFHPTAILELLFR